MVQLVATFSANKQHYFNAARCGMSGVVLLWSYTIWCCSQIRGRDVLLSWTTQSCVQKDSMVHLRTFIYMYVWLHAHKPIHYCWYIHANTSKCLLNKVTVINHCSNNQTNMHKNVYLSTWPAPIWETANVLSRPPHYLSFYGIFFQTHNPQYFFKCNIVTHTFQP